MVFFTDHAGATKAGVLMPRTFEGAEQTFDRPVELRTPELALFHAHYDSRCFLPIVSVRSQAPVHDGGRRVGLHLLA